LPVFKTGALNRSATLPSQQHQWLITDYERNVSTTFGCFGPNLAPNSIFAATSAHRTNTFVTKKVAAAGEAEAKKNNLNSAFAIVEPSGALVYFAKMDGTFYGAINVAMDKAASAALYRRPTAAFDAGIKAGGTYLLTLRGMNAVPGGIPIIADGKLIGAVGVSGGSGPEDAQVAQAAAAALK
jgi:glc operon protein GlcG